MKLKIGEGKILQTIVGETQDDIEKGEEKSYDLDSIPWPIESDSVDEIKVEGALEKVEDVVGMMGEIWRVGKKDAKVLIVVPFFNSSSANSNPENKNYFNFATFNYFTKEEGKTNKNFRVIAIRGIPHRFGKVIPNFRLPRFLVRNKFIKFRDVVSHFIGEIDQYLYIELEVEKLD